MRLHDISQHPDNCAPDRGGQFFIVDRGGKHFCHVWDVGDHRRKFAVGNGVTGRSSRAGIGHPNLNCVDDIRSRRCHLVPKTRRRSVGVDRGDLADSFFKKIEQHARPSYDAATNFIVCVLRGVDLILPCRSVSPDCGIGVM